VVTGFVREERPGRCGDGGRAAEFEAVYRENVGTITAYFARRTGDPQVAGDLTADTFVAAITSFASFDPGRGSTRGWLFGIAKNRFAQHCAVLERDREGITRLARRRDLGVDETDELLDRIVAERPGRLLLAELDGLSDRDREAIDLVHLAGLAPKEAAEALGVSSGSLRIRLFRVRARLRAVIEAWETDHG
jgi:RNA polymerase sigma factor (sigma-70 family)